MAIFIGINLNKSRMVGSIRKDSGACLRALRLPCAFLFERRDFMIRKQYLFIVLLALVGGFLGGLLSNRFFIVDNAFAEKQVTVNKVIRAEKYEVVDKEGNVRAELKTTKNGVGFHMMNKKRESVFGIAYSDKESCSIILINNNEGKPIAIVSTKNELPVLEFFDKRGKGRLELSLSLNGEPAVILKNEKGTNVSNYMLDDKGNPYLTMNDDKEELLLIIGRDLNGSSIFLNDSTGALRLGMVIDHDNPRIALFDRKGKVLWSKP